MAIPLPIPAKFPEILLSSSFNTTTVISLTLFFILLCACIVIGHLLEETRWANESITALLLGLCAGLIVLVVSKGKSSRLLVFNEELFFIYLLPPIIFNAGFQVKKKKFFRNFSTILLFGVVGTLISFCIISIGAWFLLEKIGVTSLGINDSLALGAIFSATDSVCTLQVLNQEETPLLYSLVFGEGVVNDATSIVLFNAVQKYDFSNINAFTALKLLGTFLYLFFTSTALGIAVGLLSAYGIKKLYFGRHSTDREFAIMIIMAYLSYMVAELCSLSGILTVFFCGIVMSHYTWHNVTESSRITSRHAFATISFIAETFIFLYVGMDALDMDKWKTSKASYNNFLQKRKKLWKGTKIQHFFLKMFIIPKAVQVQISVDDRGTSISISATFLALVLIGRAAFVYPLACIANCFKTRVTTIIDLRQQFIIWWAGLMRGAVTIALSYNKFATASSSTEQDYALLITCTIIVVLFSTVVFGSITKPLMELLLFRRTKPGNQESDPASLEEIRLLFLERENAAAAGNPMPNPMRSSLSLLIRHPTSTVHYFWRKFDDRFMRPIFGGRGFVPFVPGSPSGAADENV